MYVCVASTVGALPVSPGPVLSHTPQTDGASDLSDLCIIPSGLSLGILSPPSGNPWEQLSKSDGGSWWINTSTKAQS